MELLSYRGKPSVALSDLFSSFLTILLSDSNIASMLTVSIPNKVKFSYRRMVSSSGAIDEDDKEELFDINYNGLKLLPKKIKADLVDPQQWPAVLRAIILRLYPISDSKESLQDLREVLIHCRFHQDTDSKLGSVLARVNRVLEWGEHQKNKKYNSSAASSGPIGSSSLSVKELNSIQSPRSRQEQDNEDFEASLIDKDSAFVITANVLEPLEQVLEAAQQLEIKEPHELSSTHKVVMLKVLVDICFETHTIDQVLEANAEERSNQIQNMNKLMKEQKLKQKEVSTAKREAAVKLFKKMNSESAKAGQKSNKLPYQDQLNSLIEEMVFLEVTYLMMNCRENLYFLIMLW